MSDPNGPVARICRPEDTEAVARQLGIPGRRSARPSVHPPFTKSYAIDQIDDIERLRAVAHRMWEAFFAAHSQASHAIAVLMDFETCTQCMAAIGGESDVGCEKWREWQRKVTAGFGSV